MEIGLKEMPCGFDITLNFRLESIDDIFSEKQLPINITGLEYRTIETLCEGMRTSVKRGFTVAKSLLAVIAEDLLKRAIEVMRR